MLERFEVFSFKVSQVSWMFFPLDIEVSYIFKAAILPEETALNISSKMPLVTFQFAISSVSDEIPLRAFCQSPEEIAFAALEILKYVS